MNLYIIKRSPGCFVEDAFDYAVVAAETSDVAKHIHPTPGVTWRETMWIKGGREYGFDVWSHPRNLRSTLIGIANLGTKRGMVCTSFN